MEFTKDEIEMLMEMHSKSAVNGLKQATVYVSVGNKLEAAMKAFPPAKDSKIVTKKS